MLYLCCNQAISEPPSSSALSAGVFDGRPAPFYQAPWMSGMYVGQLDSEKGGVYPGWSPDRDPKSKW
jgi:hypothetical protein